MLKVLINFQCYLFLKVAVVELDDFLPRVNLDSVAKVNPLGPLLKTQTFLNTTYNHIAAGMLLKSVPGFLNTTYNHITAGILLKSIPGLILNYYNTYNHIAAGILLKSVPGFLNTTYNHITAGMLLKSVPGFLNYYLQPHHRWNTIEICSRILKYYLQPHRRWNAIEIRPRVFEFNEIKGGTEHHICRDHKNQKQKKFAPTSANRLTNRHQAHRISRDF